MSQQLAEWCGPFGRSYLERNQVDPATRMDWFYRTLSPLNLRSVLEIGTNRGHNLDAIDDALDGQVYADGCEPADFARRQARIPGRLVYSWSAYNIPQEQQWDLCFTSGVLIHVPPDRLDLAMANIAGAARRFVLAIEYFRAEDTELPYRGLDGMLWGRDYGAHYLRVCPGLRLRETGDLTEADGFADSRYWLLEKGDA